LSDVAFAALHDLVHDELERRIAQLDGPIVVILQGATRGHPGDSRN
jgi:hypothetical protein